MGCAVLEVLGRLLVLGLIGCGACCIVVIALLVFDEWSGVIAKDAAHQRRRDRVKIVLGIVAGVLAIATTMAASANSHDQRPKAPKRPRTVAPGRIFTGCPLLPMVGKESRTGSGTRRG